MKAENPSFINRETEGKSKKELCNEAINLLGELHQMMEKDASKMDMSFKIEAITHRVEAIEDMK